jgi:hypothetical protein
MKEALREEEEKKLEQRYSLHNDLFLIFLVLKHHTLRSAIQSKSGM